MRRLLIAAVVVAVPLSFMGAFAGSLTDECIVSKGDVTFDGGVGRSAAEVIAPSLTNPSPAPSVTVDEPGIDQLDPTVTFTPPGVEPGEPEVLPPNPTIVDHDGDGVPDDVTLGGGGVNADPQIIPGYGPVVEGIETHGGVSVDPDTSVDPGGIAAGERGGEYTYEAPIECTSDFGTSEGTLSVGKTYVDGGPNHGTASGSVSCDGGEANGLAVITFTDGLMAGNSFLGSWHTKWIVDRFEADTALTQVGTLENRADDPDTTDFDESAYPHFVPSASQGGGFVGSLFHADFDTDPEGPEESASAQCDDGTMVTMKLSGYLLPAPTEAFIGVV